MEHSNTRHAKAKAVAANDDTLNGIKSNSASNDSSDLKPQSRGSIIIAANGSHLSAKELKATLSFRKILERDGHKVERRGKGYACHCPFHDDRTPSFFIWENDTGGKCFGCNWYGDLFSYEMEYHELDFASALKRLQKGHKTLADACRKPETKKTQAEALTSDQVHVQHEASKRLADEEYLLGRVADPRGWKHETIKTLADDGSLGWCRGALAFIYPTGLKLRDWPHRTFVWEFGHGSLWRSHALKDSQIVYLTEGETDAISLVNAGAEQPGSCVVSLPSATTIPADLAQALSGKDVTLCMDNDKAGETATEALIELLEPVCASLQEFDWKEVG